MQPASTIYSIGHSNHSMERFVGLLKQHQIEVVVDVRSIPYSKYSPHFDTGPIKPALLGAGVKYLYFGKELGGRPDGDEFYDEAGYVLYSQVAKSTLFCQAKERILTGIGKYKVALMCGEENPCGCHRRHLVGRALAAHRVEMVHIRGDGKLSTEAELESANDTGQLTLFAEQKAEPEWKSLKPVQMDSAEERQSSFLFS